MQSVREVMTTNVEYCTPLDNVYEVALKMKELNVGAVPICENDELIGMITDRDLVVRGYAEKKSGSAQVTEVMSEALHTITQDTSVEEAANLMAEYQIRRLPVVDKGRLIGIVSLGDISLNDQTADEAETALHEISEPPEMHQ
ncbi:CBS domain-containing protein [Bacillus marinisedimentorum]|uniref:CBS domain-containing protein n=1 Tax=Bacillus marinisedimentorum TaxID=1821260 RepID=UPI000871D494|nr:CBS domain-containing protein [Bacillus marinisedimentorum]